MRIFKYWKKVTKELNIHGTKQPSSSYGGSNLSIEDAVSDGMKRLQVAQNIINNTTQQLEAYEADIIEEVIDEIDRNNIITRNRYGALVLNCKNLMFIDVDDYAPQLNFFNLFKKKKSKKEIILERIEKTILTLNDLNLDFRIYETFNGYRIIVTGKSFEPRTAESKTLMNKFYADPLYKTLCEKQNCYRARLTPKPYRMKIKAHKVIFPERNDSQQADHNNWVQYYESESSQFSSCYFIKSYGVNTNNTIINYHDKMTNTIAKKKLA